MNGCRKKVKPFGSIQSFKLCPNHWNLCYTTQRNSNQKKMCVFFFKSHSNLCHDWTFGWPTVSTNIITSCFCSFIFFYLNLYWPIYFIRYQSRFIFSVCSHNFLLVRSVYGRMVLIYMMKSDLLSKWMYEIRTKKLDKKMCCVGFFHFLHFFISFKEAGKRSKAMNRKLQCKIVWWMERFETRLLYVYIIFK